MTYSSLDISLPDLKSAIAVVEKLLTVHVNAHHL